MGSNPYLPQPYPVGETNPFSICPYSLLCYLEIQDVIVRQCRYQNNDIVRTLNVQQSNFMLSPSFYSVKKNPVLLSHLHIISCSSYSRAIISLSMFCTTTVLIIFFLINLNKCALIEWLPIFILRWTFVSTYSPFPLS